MQVHQIDYGMKWKHRKNKDKANQAKMLEAEECSHNEASLKLFKIKDHSWLQFINI